MNAAIYCRVSTREQSTLNQEMALTEYCKRNNINIYNLYKDEGVSGSKTSRPELNDMLQDMRQRHFDTIIVWKLDRLGRSTQHLLQILEELRNRNVRLICTDMNIDTFTAQGKFFFTVVSAFAELEREIIRERINAGIERARKEGKHLGRKKGSKDKKPRNKLGYIQRWSKKNRKKHTPTNNEHFSYMNSPTE